MQKALYLIAVLLSLTSATEIAGQELKCDIRKSYPANPETQLAVSNKYGNITIINTDVDSVIICGTITIDHPDPSIAASSIKLVSMQVKYEDKSININTIFDDKFFSPAYKNGRKGFNINYIIKAPDFININLDNSFGDIVVDHISGGSAIRLVHGNLMAEKLSRGNEKPVNSIIIRDSKVKIANSNWLSVESVNCPSVEIASAQALSLISESSTISIGRVNSIVMSSRYDIVTIGNVTNCIAETWLSKLKISGLTDMLEVDGKISTIRIDDVSKGFRNIVLKGESSAFTLAFKTDVSFLLNAGLKEATADISGIKEHNLEKDSGSNTSYNLRGIVGPDQKTFSRLEAGITKGKLELITTAK